MSHTLKSFDSLSNPGLNASSIDTKPFSLLDPGSYRNEVQSSAPTSLLAMSARA